MQRWFYIAQLILSAGLAFSQEPPKPPVSPPPTPQQNPAEAENRDLSAAINDASNSPVDMVRLLEAFLKKYPNAIQKTQIENAIARAAIETQDHRRTVLYGELVLKETPDDVVLLDRVARALLMLGGRENAGMSLTYSRAFAESIHKAAPPTGRDAARKQEERDRALARALIYQSRAQSILGDDAAAAKLAGESYSVFPTEEAAREWAQALDHSGQTKEAVTHMADAFAIPDTHATPADRSDDRRLLGEMYRKVHHSEKGMGDLILAAYDRTSALVTQRADRLKTADPNSSATDPMQFTLTGLKGDKLVLGSLKGSVVILDFWATWCTPCRAQHPLYEQVKQRFKNRKDVIFLAIDADEDHDLVSPFLEKQKWDQNVYFEDGLQRLLQVTSIPTTVLFDKQGRMASRMNGFLPDRFVDQLSERIQNALDEAQ